MHENKNITLKAVLSFKFRKSNSYLRQSLKVHNTVIRVILHLNLSATLRTSELKTDIANAHMYNR